MLDMGSVRPERKIIVSSLQQVFDKSKILVVICLDPIRCKRWHVSNVSTRPANYEELQGSGQGTASWS